MRVNIPSVTIELTNEDRSTFKHLLYKFISDNEKQDADGYNIGNYWNEIQLAREMLEEIDS